MANIEHLYAEPSQPQFLLDEFDETLLNDFVSDLDPTQPLRLVREFNLESPSLSFEQQLSCLVSRVNDISSAYNNAHLTSGTRDNTPCVFDTGATNNLTPFRSDFLDYQEVDLDVKAVGSVGKIIGYGTVLYRLKTRCGHFVYRPGLAYHMPASDIRLYSPQASIDVYRGEALIKGRNIAYTLPDGRIVDIPFCPDSNLPLFKDFVCSSEEKQIYGTRFKHSHALYINQAVSFNRQQVGASDGLEPGIFVGTSVAGETNQNLPNQQKELLHWHHKLCMNMQDLQNLMQPQHYKDAETGKTIELPPILPTKYKSMKNYTIPLCLACKLANMKSRGAKTTVTKKLLS
mmetsp:Transcript_4245/g.9634  ORF Transcript_4245/g.9634 Transcript_4245/m.9634 type:complete len:345 (+) Transcript_4245:2650-3684(+)